MSGLTIEALLRRFGPVYDTLSIAAIHQEGRISYEVDATSATEGMVRESFLSLQSVEDYLCEVNP